jgi:hypothetical protein
MVLLLVLAAAGIVANADSDLTARSIGRPHLLIVSATAALVVMVAVVVALQLLIGHPEIGYGVYDALPR